MNREDFLQLLDYNYWATRRLLDAAKQATEEELMASSAVTGQSIHSTLVHLMDGERLWRLRLAGEWPDSLSVPSDFSSFEDVEDAIVEQEAAMRSFAATLSDEDLAGTALYRNTKGVEYEQKRWQILSHVINHGTQHRAEAALLLTELGYSPGDVDFIMYLREKG